MDIKLRDPSDLSTLDSLIAKERDTPHATATASPVLALAGTQALRIAETPGRGRTFVTEYEWLYVFAAVNPETGQSGAVLTPTINTGSRNAHLQHVGEQVGPQRPAVLVLDGAGWHVAKAWKLPLNITLLDLPPDSPELNPMERLWAYMKSHYLSNQVFKDYDDLFAKAAWLQLDDPRLQSLTQTAWCAAAK